MKILSVQAALIFVLSVVAVAVGGPYYNASVGERIVARAAEGVADSREALATGAQNLPSPLYSLFALDGEFTIRDGAACRGRLSLRTFPAAAPSLTLCENLADPAQGSVVTSFRADDILRNSPNASMVVYTDSRFVVAAHYDFLLWGPEPEWLPLMVETKIPGLPLSVVTWAPLWFLLIPFGMTFLVVVGARALDGERLGGIADVLHVAFTLPWLLEAKPSFVDELGDISRTTAEAVEDVDARAEWRQRKVAAMINQMEERRSFSLRGDPFSLN